MIRAYDLRFRRADGGPATVRRLVPLGDRVKVEAQVDGAGSLFAQVSRHDPVLRDLEPARGLLWTWSTRGVIHCLRSNPR